MLMMSSGSLSFILSSHYHCNKVLRFLLCFEKVLLGSVCCRPKTEAHMLHEASDWFLHCSDGFVPKRRKQLTSFLSCHSCTHLDPKVASVSDKTSQVLLKDIQNTFMPRMDLSCGSVCFVGDNSATFFKSFQFVDWFFEADVVIHPGANKRSCLAKWNTLIGLDDVYGLEIHSFSLIEKDLLKDGSDVTSTEGSSFVIKTDTMTIILCWKENETSMIIPWIIITSSIK